jgi:hypothetical protein
MFMQQSHPELEIQERSQRQKFRLHAALLQSFATYFAAGAAIEAASSSQHDFISHLLLGLGVAIVLIPSSLRWYTTRRDIALNDAWNLKLAWAMENKDAYWGRSDESKKYFANQHPRENKILQRYKRL